MIPHYPVCKIPGFGQDRVSGPEIRDPSQLPYDLSPLAVALVHVTALRGETVRKRI